MQTAFTFGSRARVIAWCASVIPTGAVLAVSIVPIGTEFQINSRAARVLAFASVDAARNGAFLVVWASTGDDDSDGSDYDIFARRFDPSGQAWGEEQQVNSYTSGDQANPTPAVLESGAFVVAWESQKQDGEGSGVFARRFEVDGTPVAVEFQVNIHTLYSQSTPDLDVNNSGEMVISWSSLYQDPSLQGVFARRYDPAGLPRGGELQVNTYTLDSQVGPSVIIDDDGAFIVSWSGLGDSAFGIFARRFDSTGAPSSADFQVNSYMPLVLAGGQRIAGSPRGEFALAWAEFSGATASSDVVARVFDPNATPTTEVFNVNLATARSHSDPAIAMDADGDFVVVWTSYNQDRDGLGIFARTFDSAGKPTSSDFQVNTHTTGHQSQPSLAIDGDGDVVITWRTHYNSESPGAVLAQRYSGPVLDIDEDGEVSSLTDGILVLRFLFGFTGDVLTSAAVDLARCDRCTTSAIEAHLDAIVDQLDVDGDGEFLPTSDGVLVLRWLFGFTGTNLVTDAVNLADCTRCSASAIEEYLEPLR